MIQSQIDAIHEENEKLRGPSLLEIHRQQLKDGGGVKKKSSKMNKQKQTTKKDNNESDDWTWKREDDLDAGRRVDKEALSMIFGSAGKELQSKFHRGR